MEMRSDWNPDLDEESEDRHKSSRSNKYTDNWEDRFTCNSKQHPQNDQEEEGSTIESGIWLGIIGANDNEASERSNYLTMEENKQVLPISETQQRNNLHLNYPLKGEGTFQAGKNSPPISFLTRNTTGRERPQLARPSMQANTFKIGPNAVPTDSVVDCSSKSALKHLMTTDTLHQQTRVFDSRGASQEKESRGLVTDKRDLMQSFRVLIETDQSHQKPFDQKRSVVQARKKSRHRLGVKPLLNLNDPKKLTIMAAPTKSMAQRGDAVQPNFSKSVERETRNNPIDAGRKFLRRSFAEQIDEEPEIRDRIGQGSGLEMNYLRVSLRANLSPSIDIKRLCGPTEPKRELSLIKKDSKLEKVKKSPDLKGKLREMFAFEESRLTLEVSDLNLSKHTTLKADHSRGPSRPKGASVTRKAKK